MSDIKALVERWHREAAKRSDFCQARLFTLDLAGLEHFAAMVAEHCASIADRTPLERQSEGYLDDAQTIGTKIGEAIRGEFGIS